MPQVWLNEEELGEFLECEPVLARHHAIQDAWPRGNCFDGVTRFELPPRPALNYVLWNARSRPEPRDAAMLEQVEDLKRQLSAAKMSITDLGNAIQALLACRTDEMVGTLQGLSAEMRGLLGLEKSASRPAARTGPPRPPATID